MPLISSVKTKQITKKSLVVLFVSLFIRLMDIEPWDIINPNKQNIDQRAKKVLSLPASFLHTHGALVIAVLQLTTSSTCPPLQHNGLAHKFLPVLVEPIWLLMHVNSCAIALGTCDGTRAPEFTLRVVIRFADLRRFQARIETVQPTVYCLWFLWLQLGQSIAHYLLDPLLAMSHWFGLFLKADPHRDTYWCLGPGVFSPHRDSCHTYAVNSFINYALIQLLYW